MLRRAGPGLPLGQGEMLTCIETYVQINLGHMRALPGARSTPSFCLVSSSERWVSCGEGTRPPPSTVSPVWCAPEETLAKAQAQIHALGPTALTEPFLPPPSHA